MRPGEGFAGSLDSVQMPNKHGGLGGAATGSGSFSHRDSNPGLPATKVGARTSPEGSVLMAAFWAGLLVPSHGHAPPALRRKALLTRPRHQAAFPALP